MHLRRYFWAKIVRDDCALSTYISFCRFPQYFLQYFWTFLPTVEHMGFFVNSKDTRQGKVTWTVHQGSHQVIIKISPCDNFRSQANWPCLFHRLETDARIMVLEVMKKIVISLFIYILRFWCKKLFCGVFSWVKKVWIINIFFFFSSLGQL